MIYVVGLGPGKAEYLTLKANEILAKATVIIGNPRQLAALPESSAIKLILDSKLSSISGWIKENENENENEIVVLASGDPMLYGIGKYLSEQLGADNVAVIPGISSIQYLFSKLNLDMNNCYLTSSHGRIPDFDFIFNHEKIAMVTDDKIGPFEIAHEIIKRGLKRRLIVGENLSYPDEIIQQYSEKTVPKRNYSMNVVVILNER